jgi:hypothetical protein
VVKLVDAEDSKSSDRKVMPVQVRPPAPELNQGVNLHWVNSFFLWKRANCAQVVPAERIEVGGVPVRDHLQVVVADNVVAVEVEAGFVAEIIMANRSITD